MFIKKDYPDVLYLVKPSEENDELKYSLRSLKNLNHGRVFLAGYKPSWVGAKYEHIPVEQSGKKYQNTRNNLITALQDDRLSDDFILMNDDFFIMKPTDRVPPLRRLRPIEHYIELFQKLDPDSYYVQTMRQTRDLLREWGMQEIDSYELHVPVIFNKQKLAKVLEMIPEGMMPHIRTVYGNYYKIGGERIEDVKIIRDDQVINEDARFLSTIDGSFEEGAVGRYLRDRFSRVMIFSHANDPDGVLNVILAQLAFPEVDYLLTNNPQRDIMAYIEAHDMSCYDKIFITDIYPGLPVLRALPHAYWFDHKEHSLRKIEEHNLNLPHTDVRVEANGRKVSASQLFYDWLCQHKLINGTQDIAAFVEYIRRQDTWDL